MACDLFAFIGETPVLRGVGLPRYFAVQCLKKWGASWYYWLATSTWCSGGGIGRRA